MTIGVSYTIEVISTTGDVEDFITDVTTLTAARSFGNVGNAVFSFPAGDSIPSWKRNHRFRFFRNHPSGISVPLGGTVWFLKKKKYIENSNEIHITCTDSLGLLDQRLVAYASETLKADKTLFSRDQIVYDDTYLAGNMMNDFVEENFGATATDTDRDISDWLAVEADKNVGAHVEKAASFQKVLSTLVEISRQSKENGQDIAFDLVAVADGTFLFRVFEDTFGSDRSSTSENPLILAPEYGNINNVELEFDYSTEVNVVYVGGVLSGAKKLIVTVTDAELLRSDPFSRSELYYEAGENGDDSHTEWMTKIGEQQIAGARAKANLMASIVETPVDIFGRDFGYGFKVTTRVKNFQFDCIINAFNVAFNAGVENLDVRLQSTETL